MYRFFLLLAIVFAELPLFAATCPDGYTAYLGPATNLVRNANGGCSELCGAGITSLNTSNGYRFDLFVSKNTTPAINVGFGGTTCYADLLSGGATRSLNVKYDGATYHANISTGELCPLTYTLSYSCGTGATGTPPDSIEVAYGDLYTAPYDSGTCYRAGYYISGWKIDSTSLTSGGYYNYTYKTDKTMIAQWTANPYGGAYLCNNGTSNSSYLTATYGGSVTPSTTVCTAASGATFAGYKILDVWGNDTGDVVASGASFTWTYPYNIRLQAIWE